MADIVKAIVTVTVLLEADDENLLANASLGNVAYQIDEGDWIGSMEITSCTPVAPGDLAKELIAIGNDGSFFSLDDDE